MSGISSDGYAIALPTIAPALATVGQTFTERQEARILEQAEQSVSARLSTTPDVAREMLVGIARSQGRELEEYAAAVIANRGRLDV